MINTWIDFSTDFLKSMQNIYFVLSTAIAFSDMPQTSFQITFNVEVQLHPVVIVIVCPIIDDNVIQFTGQ